MFGNFSKPQASTSATVPTTGTDQYPPTPRHPVRPALSLQAVVERQRWKAHYTAAQLVTSGVRNRVTTVRQLMIKPYDQGEGHVMDGYSNRCSPREPQWTPG